MTIGIIKMHNNFFDIIELIPISDKIKHQYSAKINKWIHEIQLECTTNDVDINNKDIAESIAMLIRNDIRNINRKEHKC